MIQDFWQFLSEFLSYNRLHLGASRNQQFDTLFSNTCFSISRNKWVSYSLLFVFVCGGGGGRGGGRSCCSCQESINAARYEKVIEETNLAHKANETREIIKTLTV